MRDGQGDDLPSLLAGHVARFELGGRLGRGRGRDGKDVPVERTLGGDGQIGHQRDRPRVEAGADHGNELQGRAVVAAGGACQRQQFLGGRVPGGDHAAVPVVVGAGP